MPIIQLRVDQSLQQVLENLRIDLARNIKKQYGLSDIQIHGTVASQILAAKHKGKKALNYRIKKVGLNRGVLELIG